MGWDTLTASVITGVSSSLATLLFVTAARLMSDDYSSRPTTTRIPDLV